LANFKFARNGELFSLRNWVVCNDLAFGFRVRKIQERLVKNFLEFFAFCPHYRSVPEPSSWATAHDERDLAQLAQAVVKIRDGELQPG
jgi:hypothetical protein